MRVKYLFLSFLVVAQSLAGTLASAEEPALEPAVKAASEGDVDKLSEAISPIAGDENAPDSIRAKAFAMLAFAYFLNGGDDAKDKCSLLVGAMPEEGDCAYAATVTGFLAGEVSDEDLTNKLVKAPRDWRAAEELARYLVAASNNAKAEALSEHYSNYRIFLTGGDANSWIAAWITRVPLWHKWLIAGQGDKASLEKLIATHGLAFEKLAAKGERSKRLKAVGSVLDLYVKNDIPAAKKLAAEWKGKLTSPKDAPVALVMDYLAGNTKITPDKLFKTTGSDVALWLSACVAMFVVNVADTKALDKQMLDYCLNNIQGNAKILGNNPVMGRWSEAAKKWRAWFDAGFKKEAASDPLLVARSVVPPKVYDVTTTTLEDFVADREKTFKGRPTLVGLRCSGAALDAYLATLPPERRKVEEARYKTIQDLKHHVTRMLERNPYPNGILVKRRGGKGKPMRYRGTIAMGNDNFLVLRKKRYKWEVIAIPFYEEFMTFYAKQRVTTDGVANNTLEERRADAAEDYLGVAILYDWVGDYEKALDFAKRAVIICPAKKKKISVYMLK